MDRSKSIKKFLATLLLIVAVSPWLFTDSGQTKIQPYYSGDAIVYQGRTVIGTADSGYLEIFKLSGAQLLPLVRVKIYNGAYNTYTNYSDLTFSVENGHLYVYAVSQYTVFKYDFSDLAHLVLVNSVKNTYWDWYYRVNHYGDNIGLVNKTGLTIINSNLQPVVAFSFSPSEHYSLRGNDNQYLTGLDNGKLEVYDRNQGALAKQIPLNFNTSGMNHQVYRDPVDGSLYAIDDYYMKKFSPDGQLLASFRHLDAPGYDAVSQAGNPYVYFSNGLGIVQMNKSDLKVKNYVYTTNLGGPQGWAMGLKLLATAKGDELVVFNASNILVLDKNLHKVASVAATEAAGSQGAEPLFLNFDHSSALPGAVINLSGGGYWAGEKLDVSFGTTSVATLTADSEGRFLDPVTVPSLSAQRLDIKVVGENSGLHYSVSFAIK